MRKVQFIVYLAEASILAGVLTASGAPSPLLLAATLPLPCHLALLACTVSFRLPRLTFRPALRPLEVTP